MNILVLSDAFWPDHTGGISKSLLTEVEELAARGHRVVVVTRRLRRDLPPHESRGYCELYRYPSPFKGTALYRLYPLYSIRKVANLLPQLQKKYSFDVAYVHNPFQAVGLLHSSARIPYVYVFHAPTTREIEIEATRGKYGMLTPLLNLTNRWIKRKEREALTHARSVVVRSKYMGEEMRQLHGDVGKGKTVCIPLCVDTQRFSFVENPRAIRKEIDLPLDRPILLTVRRLVARMGLENLISSISLVARRVPNVLLLIGGEGYLERFLRQQVKDLHIERNVEFLGFISEERLPKYYQAADLFVLPTMALEGFGLATIEALSCGTPVVATPIGANPEVIGPLGQESLCQNTSPEALAERITWFIERGVEMTLRKRCREYCESNFAIQKVVSTIEKVLVQVIEHNDRACHVSG